MKKGFRIITLILSLVVLLTMVSNALTSSAAESFSWKEYDAGYVTFIYDDGRDVAVLGTIAKKYNVPFCFSIVGETVDPENPQRNSVLTTQLLDLQNRGCEILSHTYSHNAFSADSDAATIEEELSKSYNALTAAGFNVNGIIEAGSGGAEKRVDYNLVEASAKKYYKYSDSYGTSPQYKFERTWMNGLGSVKGAVNKAGRSKTWLVLSGHSLSDLSASELEELINYITVEKGMKIVTVKYMYETFGNYPTAQDFGPTYYTVDYADTSGNIIESKVCKKGDNLPTPPEGYAFAEIGGTVENNTVIKAAENSNQAAQTENPTKQDSPLKWIIPVAAAVLLVIAVVVIILIKKK